MRQPVALEEPVSQLVHSMSWGHAYGATWVWKWLPGGPLVLCAPNRAYGCEWWQSGPVSFASCGSWSCCIAGKPGGIYSSEAQNMPARTMQRVSLGHPRSHRKISEGSPCEQKVSEHVQDLWTWSAISPLFVIRLAYMGSETYGRCELSCHTVPGVHQELAEHRLGLV